MLLNILGTLLTLTLGLCAFVVFSEDVAPYAGRVAWPVALTVVMVGGVLCAIWR